MHYSKQTVENWTTHINCILGWVPNQIVASLLIHQTISQIHEILEIPNAFGCETHGLPSKYFYKRQVTKNSQLANDFELWFGFILIIY